MGQKSPKRGNFGAALDAIKHGIARMSVRSCTGSPAIAAFARRDLAVAVLVFEFNVS